MEKFIMAGGIPVRYSDYGKGEQTICLLHGYLESIETWDNFGGLLGKEFRVITIDLPGHGMSDRGSHEVLTMEIMANAVNEILEKVGVEKCVLIGHSMGGYVAAAMIELHPERLESVIFFHSTANADSPEKIESRKREIEIIRAGKKELLSLSGSVDSEFAPQNRNRCREEIDELAEQVMMTEDEAIVASLNGMMQRKDRNEAVASFGKPVLFIFGKFDNRMTPEIAEVIMQKQPKAEFVWLENSAHFGFIEQPKESLETIRNFVTKQQ